MWQDIMYEALFAKRGEGKHMTARSRIRRSGSWLILQMRTTMESIIRWMAAKLFEKSRPLPCDPLPQWPPVDEASQGLFGKLSAWPFRGGIVQ